MTAVETAGLERHVREGLETKPILLMTHVVVGYPSLEANWTMLEAMEAAGVDLVELQLPFSEPIADGPSFVRANQEAIRAGTAWATYFDFATRASKQFRFPLLFMGYYNSVFRMGGARFCTRLAAAGMRGFIVADLPPEEALELNAMARAHELDPILLMTPANHRSDSTKSAGTRRASSIAWDGRASPERRRTCRRAWRNSWRGAGRQRRCPSRSASGSGRPPTYARSEASPTSRLLGPRASRRGKSADPTVTASSCRRSRARPRRDARRARVVIAAAAVASPRPGEPATSSAPRSPRTASSSGPTDASSSR
jgi:hypothetical protein